MKYRVGRYVIGMVICVLGWHILDKVIPEEHEPSLFIGGMCLVVGTQVLQVKWRWKK